MSVKAKICMALLPQWVMVVYSPFGPLDELLVIHQS